MLVTKTVTLKIANNMKLYYKNLGYEVPNISNPILEISTVDLSKGCCIKIDCVCGICGNIRNTVYKYYREAIDKYGYYTCKGICTQQKTMKINLIKYGTEEPNRTPEMKEKIKKLNLEKYGVDHPGKLDTSKDTKTENCIKKYGVKSTTQLTDVKNKIKKTNLEKYGNVCPLQNKLIKDIVKNIIIKKYGVENISQNDEIKRKKKKTSLENNSVDYPMQSENIRKKSKNTCLKNYGVENPMQNIDIFNKSKLSGFKMKKYEDINYQGTYELDFLEKYYIIGLSKVKSIRYYFEDKNKVYHPDFYYEKLNLIVEIKSDYYYNKDLDKNLAKQKACIEQGYDFIFIINKKYDEFDKKIKEN